MIYIDHNDKIMVNYNSTRLKEITNDTGFLPLCVYYNVVLLSNYKLYRVNHLYGTLRLIQMETGKDYVLVDADNFTDKFAQINSEYYQIVVTSLCKITIPAKNSRNILISGDLYFYCDINNNLLCCSRWYVDHASDNKSSLIDDNCDMLLRCCHCNTDSKHHICYSKANKIICRKLIASVSSIVTEIEIEIETYDVDYDGSTIIKIIDDTLLNSDGVLLSLKLYYVTDRCKFCITTKILNVYDFNIIGNTLIYSKNVNQIYNVKKFIDSGCFKKVRTRVKSAAASL